jgi:hypothetical protein
LASAAIERQHQVSGEALARRVLRQQALQLADQCGVPAHGEIGVHARLQGRQPLLLQARDLRLRERLELQLR